jgi:hypothetical protein
MGDGFSFDPEILKRVWGEILPIAADNYDNAVERLNSVTPPLADNVLKVVASAFTTALNGGGGTGTLRMLAQMQNTILAAANRAEQTMNQFLAQEQEAVARLEEAYRNSIQMSGPHPVDGQP